MKQSGYFLRKARRRISSKPFLVLIKVSVLGIFLLFLAKSVIATGLFHIVDITLTGETSFVSPKDIKTVLDQNLLGKNLLYVKPDQVSLSITSAFPALRSVSIKKVYPDKVQVDVFERVPVALLTTDDSSFYLIDKEGYILGFLGDFKDSAYPVLKYATGAEVIGVGRFVQMSKFSKLITFLSILRDNDVAISSVTAFDNNLDLLLKTGTHVFASFDKDLTSSTILLKDTLRKYSLENVVLKKVDLRYDNLVVEY